MSSIMVSICCTCYNHEKYIRNAIEGFLMQETAFDYEILIHDDASTDNSQSIIVEYEKKYPTLIKSVLQKENQYSQGIGVINILFEKAQGKYIAVCEGDDYWIDPFKLQKQVDYMIKYPECTFCFTNGIIADERGEKEDRVFIPYDECDAISYRAGNRKYSLGELCSLSFVPTASFFFPKRNLEILPESYNERCPAGDLKMRLFFTALGEAYYIDDKTCIYRENVPNSAMTKWKRASKQATYIRLEKVVNMINNVDVYSKFVYSKELNLIKDKSVLGMLLNATNISVFRNKDCKRVFLKSSIKVKLKILFKFLVPDIVLDLYKRRK